MQGSARSTRSTRSRSGVSVSRSSLTEALIRKLGPGWFADGRVEGLGLEIKASGAAAWRLRYTARTGERRSLTIGLHSKSTEARRTPVVGVDEARRLAGALRVKIAAGVDPVVERAHKRTGVAPTVADACDAYLRDHVEHRCTSRTAELTRDLIRRRIKQVIGRVELEHLTRPQIVAWHAQIGNPPPKGKGCGPEANRTLTVLHAALEHAAHAGMVPEGWPNPCVRIRRFPERTRVRDVLTATQRADLLRELRDGPLRPERSAGHVSQHIADALELCAETGMRAGEVCRLRWRHIDIPRRLLLLEGTKTGLSTRPLSQRAVDALTRISWARFDSRPRPDDLVCPTSTGTEIMRVNLTGAWGRLRRRIDGASTVPLHGLRHGVATSLLESGARLEDAQRVLGHASIATTARYVHDSTDRAREALDNAAAVLAGTAPPLRLVQGGKRSRH